MIQTSVKFARASFVVLLLAACGTSGSQSVDLKDQIDVGEQLVKVGQHDRAFGILEGISQSGRNSAATHIQVGNAYLRSDALLRANESYSRAARLGAVKEANVGFGKIALRRNDAEGAQTFFAKVLKVDARNVEALNGMGVAYDLMGNHSQAQENYRMALGIQPDAFKVLNNLGLSMTLSGNSEGAVSILSDLTESRLDSQTSRLNLAIALSRTGRKQDALKLAGADVANEDALALFNAVDGYRGKSS